MGFWGNGILFTKTVKYLGVKVAVEKKDQIRISKEQITKNVQLLKWRLKRVDNDVLERLTCCLFCFKRSFNNLID